MKYRYIIFDFDGVLVESNEIRFNGFRKLFENYPEDQVERLVAYAKANGGVSRYQKIKYFFNEICLKPITEESVNEWADKFSKLVAQDVVTAKSVEGSVEFLEEYSNVFDFAIVSGSDQVELRNICRQRKIDHFFKMILGSPVEKKDNIASLLTDLNWTPSQSLYVGDSNNDLDAAKANNLNFIGRCSGLIDWKSSDIRFVDDLSSLGSVLSGADNPLS
jgi:phosphoglycolate phosphatase-like HAD superfamily hydrolase